MLANFPPSDTGSFRILRSTRTKPPPNVCISVPPPLWRRQIQIFQTYNTGEKTRKSDFIEGIEKNDESSDDDGASGSDLNGEYEIPGNDDETIDSGIFEAPESRVRRKGDSELISGSTVRINGKAATRGSLNVDRKNSNDITENLERPYSIRKPDRGFRKYAKIRSSANPRLSVEKMRTKHPTKWTKYGGCIPAMLNALDTIYDLDEALRPWAMTLTNKERSILLKEQQRWERAVELFKWFKRKRCYEINVIHYNIMLRILGKARQWCEVERLWKEMENTGIEPVNSTYGTLIDVCCKGGHKENAMKWLDLMNKNEIEPDEVTMGIVVQMYKKAGDFVSAEKFFKNHKNGVFGINEAKNGDSPLKGCLSTNTYNNLIDTYGKAGKLQEAYETFETMLHKGIVPTTVTFNTLIHMYGLDGQLDKVASLMQRMDDAKCRRDTRTYNILIFVHAKHNDIELATLYFRKMKEASLEPDAVSYRTLLYAFSIRHMVIEAEELISEMDNRGLEIDEFTQSSLTRMYIQAGMLEQSWSWFLKFHLCGKMTSSCYSAIIDAYGETGYISEARKVFDCCLQVKKVTVLEFNVLVKAYGISKQFDQACSSFDSMEKYGLVPDRCGYNSIIQMLASADLPQKAASYLRKMQKSELIFDCIPYCAVISSYIKMGRRDKAVELYNEMIGFGIKPDVVVFGVLINAFAEVGSVKEASYYVELMRSHNLPMNSVVCKSLIKLYTKVGYLQEAQKAYNTLKSLQTGLDIYTSNCMIDLYSKQSMVSEAEEIFNILNQNGAANEFTHAMMLCMYRRNARFSEAYRIARKMREEGLMKELLSYNHVIGLYSCDGRYIEAVETFEEMLESNVEPDESTFKSLGLILTKRGVPKCAVDKLEKMRIEERESGLKAWCSTLCSIVRVGDDGFRNFIGADL